MSTTKIDKRIVKYRVEKPADKAQEQEKAAAAPAEARKESNVVWMHEKVERPEMLLGSTYKIKTPVSDHAMYVTINDIVLNAGSEHEQRRPFEVFINSKSMEHFQWIVALTRIMSAVFRKGGDVTFIVEEMKAVFDPKGGYFKAGGVYMPSLVAELGTIVEDHLKTIGLMHDPELSEHQRALIAEKRRAYDEQQNNGSKKNAEVAKTSARTERSPAQRGEVEGQAPDRSTPEGRSEEVIEVTGDGASFPPSATMCHKCNTKAIVIMDGCATCLNCGYSKCG